MPKGRISPTEKQCKNCSSKFTAIKPAAMHCSDKCRLEFAYKLKQQKRNKIYDRWYALKHNYNISREEYELMKFNQFNKCAICLEVPEHLLCVDHCHTTNEIRGLLCKPCNMALGLFRDKIENLDKARAYLLKGIK